MFFIDEWKRDLEFWKMNPHKIQVPSQQRRTLWLVITTWRALKSLHYGWIYFSGVALSWPALRFFPAAGRYIPTERKIERAINSCKVIYLKDCSKQRELGTNGWLCKGGRPYGTIVLGAEDKEEKRDEHIS